MHWLHALPRTRRRTVGGGAGSCVVLRATFSSKPAWPGARGLCPVSVSKKGLGFGVWRAQRAGRWPCHAMPCHMSHVTGKCHWQCHVGDVGYYPLPAARWATASQLDRSDFQSIMGDGCLRRRRRGLLSRTSGWGPPTGGLGRPGEPVVGSPTHPVMPNLVMLWKMGPSRCGRRAGGYSPLAGAASGRKNPAQKPGRIPLRFDWPAVARGGRRRPSAKAIFHASRASSL
jgi:hypothetical protein